MPFLQETDRKPSFKQQPIKSPKSLFKYMLKNKILYIIF